MILMKSLALLLALVTFASCQSDIKDSARKSDFEIDESAEISVAFVDGKWKARNKHALVEFQ